MLSREERLIRRFDLCQINGKIIKDTFFGGAEKEAAKRETEAIERGQDIIQENVAEARRVSRELIPRAQQTQRLGAQSALDILGPGFAQQLGAFQQGNILGQQTTAGALPQIQAAILGQPVDFSGLQPQQVQTDTGFLQNVQLPQFPRQQAQQQQQQQAPQLGSNLSTQLQDLLRGNAGGGLLSNFRGGF